MGFRGLRPIFAALAWQMRWCRREITHDNVWISNCNLNMCFDLKPARQTLVRLRRKPHRPNRMGLLSPMASARPCQLIGSADSGITSVISEDMREGVATARHLRLVMTRERPVL